MRSAIFLIFAGVAMAQSPTDYLGIGLDNWWFYQGVFVDSMAGDPLKSYDAFDTTKVLSQFNYNGHNAFLVYTKDSAHSDTYGDTLIIKRDTAYDDGNWARLITDVADTTVDLYAYLTPFSVGSSWSNGMAGTYHWDIDDDGQIDTIIIHTDTTYVEATETITVPAGTFSTYRLYSKTRGSIHAASGDTGQLMIDRWEWWCPDSGMIADTQFTNYIGYYGSIPVPIYYEWRSHRLVNYQIGVTEEPADNTGPWLRFAANRLDYYLPEQGAILKVYNSAGVLVMSKRLSDTRGSININLKPGIYMFKAGPARTQGFISP